MDITDNTDENISSKDMQEVMDYIETIPNFVLTKDDIERVIAEEKVKLISEELKYYDLYIHETEEQTAKREERQIDKYKWAIFSENQRAIKFQSEMEEKIEAKRNARQIIRERWEKLEREKQQEEDRRFGARA